ncbi:hypothetical protein HPB52_021427 [Rhipicephalus sanguineus]|uniref:Uncharacterized protein n=1 Tax=Rhipicephalus sanguineus TaxID=34632 RepID=A0A9D4PF74_RHISA|nr:hypothetical protein HPB52_021427 [Rhipicephalus sanguineus]
MHAVLVQELPVELHSLAAATTSSPRPYDHLSAAVLACYGETYPSLLGSREFQVFPLFQREAPAGLQPSLDHDDPSLITTPSTSVPATWASIPVPDHHDKLEDASTSTDLSNTRRMVYLPGKLKPFHAAYPRAWFLKLDAILALNGITAQPMMHAVLLQALPVELHNIAPASTSSPRPYDDQPAAVLACYGETYRSVLGSRQFQVFPLSQRGVRAGMQPSLDHDDTSLITTPSTSVPATWASIPVPDHHDKVEDASTSTDLSNTRCIFSTASAHGPSFMCAGYVHEFPALHGPRHF